MGVLVTFAVLAGFEFFVHRPIGAGAAGPPLRPADFASSWINREVFLVGLGDSVTAGFGASPGKSYFSRLLKVAPDEPADVMNFSLAKVLPRLRSTNLAVSGCTSLQLVRAQLPRIPQSGSNVLGLVVMTIGGNDLIHNYGQSPPTEGAMYGASWEQAQPWIQRFGERLEEILARVQSAFPGGCHLFLANIYDPSDGTGSLRLVGLPPWRDGGRLHQQMNQVLAQAAQRHHFVHLVDIHREFLGHGLTCRQFWRSTHRRNDPYWWYYSNVEDPNDRGYDALRRLFLNAMADAFLRPLVREDGSGLQPSTR